MVLCLKQSKTDTKYTGVQIILAATGEKTCRIAALVRLYTLDPQPANAPLFRLFSGAFSRFSVVSVPKKRISLAGLAKSNFFGHSFNKCVVQHVADYGILDEMIQQLDC